MLKRVFYPLKRVFFIILKSLKGFWEDDCLSRASGLAYTTLFALVPLTALTIIMYTAVGIDEKEVGKTIDEILSHVLPPSETPEDITWGEAWFKSGVGPVILPKSIDIKKIVKDPRKEQLDNLRKDVTGYLLALGAHAKTLGILTISILFFIGIALLNTIESALNVVWKVRSSFSSIGQKLINFWSVITFGPVFILLGIYLTTKAESLKITALNNEHFNFFVAWHTLGAILVTTFALAMMFFTLPATKVRLKDALFGAFLSALLFEGLKRGFAYYLTVSSGYSSLYGALASIPLFLFWLYLTWVVVLFGAESSYLSGKLDLLNRISFYKTDLGEMGGILGLRILMIISEQYKKGEELPTEGEISSQTGVTPSIIHYALELLTSSDILTDSDPKTHIRTLKKSPEHIKVEDILNAFRVKNHPNQLDSLSLDFIKKINYISLKEKEEIKDLTLQKLIV